MGRFLSTELRASSLSFAPALFLALSLLTDLL